MEQSLIQDKVWMKLTSCNDEPVELKNRCNSNISRALWMVNNDKIRLDAKLKIYFGCDENNECFQIKHGIQISNRYIIPNLGQMIKAKFFYKQL